MKIYLDNNLGVSNVEQEELTQDTIGYNILKVYIPNAVLTPYNVFTCYYGALLQNGRKVGWFAMEARTNTDADYEEGYTLYKATLEQCVVSVEGKVYIGCQVLLGNSGNATLIKKNTAVVQFNVRKSVAINNDILVLDTDQTTTDVLESYKNLLENALLTYATKAEVYTQAQMDALLLQKADKSDTYTKAEVNEVALGLMDDIDGVRNTTADLGTRTSVLESEVSTLQDDVNDLKSVQNVVDIVATYSALQSYDTSKLDVDDKVQVIADENHDGASTIYNWNGSAWQYVGAYGTNSYTKQETLEQIDIHKLVNKTYSELATLKANNGLVAGQKYRITDYVTKTNGKCNGVDNDVRSVEHPFDVIVTAISNNEFSENARAIQHTGDSYFANSKLEAWQLWYSFDNDSDRFEWADTTNGKGVIYRMIDEFQNDVPYDFKNIQFKRYKITGVTDSRQSTLIGEYLGFYENYNVTSDSTDYVWRFTFSKRADNSDLSLVEVNNSTFTSNAYVKQVVIGEYITDTPTYRCKQALNNIVMEVEALIVDVSMGKGSHHNTWIGNEDIDYCYFASMFRQNILFGEINHTRADECFEKNVIGDGALTTYASCWNKFTHHFSRNIGINMQSNDFEGQVDETKFPLHFTRNHISNMWDEVNASSHTTFNRCEFGYVVTATFGGTGTWDGVKSIMLWNTTINIKNFFGATLGRLEYVTISQGTNSYSILNLTTGALNGSSRKPLTINLSDISNLLPSYYEKNITFAWHNLLNAKCLVYSVKVYDKTNNLVYDTNYAGIINTANNNVTWEEVGDIGQLKALVNTKADTSYVDGKLEEVGQMFEIVGNEILNKVNADYVDNAINDLRWELGSHTLDVESDTTTAYSKSVPSGAIGCQINKLGGMVYKQENKLSISDNSFSVSGITISYLNNNIIASGTSTAAINAVVYIFTLPAGSYYFSSFAESGNNATYFTYVQKQGQTSLKTSYSNGSFTLTESTVMEYRLVIRNGVTIDTYFADTLISGTIAPTDYFSIRESAVTSVVSKDSSNNTIDTLSINTAIQNLTGYGWGINDTCYNYIDFERKMFVQKVGRVDLGTLTWNYNALGESSYFYASISNAVNSINVSCSLYESAVVLSTNTEDKIICTVQNAVRIRDNELEGSIVDLNTKLNGVYLYYELTTPVETDISAYLTTDTIDVEGGGSLEFTNTYSQDVPSDIDYLIEEVKA